MRAIIIVISIVILFGFTHGNSSNKKQKTGHESSSTQDDNTCQQCGLPFGNRGVNNGASSSTHEISRCQRCELQNYANRLVFLMTAEDRNGDADLSDMMKNQYDEMEAFYEYVNSYIKLVGLKNTENESEADRTGRLEHFDYLLEELVYQITKLSCTQHYNVHLHYTYDKQSKKIEINRTYRTEPNSCVCKNPDCEKERNMPDYNIHIPEPKYTIEQPNMMRFSDLEIEGTMMYHIIPLPLISTFFRSWFLDYAPLSYSPYDIMPSHHFNECTNILLKRLKRSVQKLILVSIKKSRVYSERDSETPININIGRTEEDVLTIQNIVSATSWLAGDIFIAPTARGPFLATFSRSSDPEGAFDHEARPLIGERRYQELLLLFNNLRDFNRQASKMHPFEKLIEGFKIYIRMTLAFSLNDVTLMDRDQWVRRRLTYEELLDVRSRLPRGRMSQTYFNRLFFTTKKFDDKRNRRSVLLTEIEASMTEEQKFRIQWSDFVSDMMRVSMEDLSLNQSLPWSCKFSHLYDQFLLLKSDTSTYDCLYCLNFDEYLYSRILQPNNWTKCSYTKKNDVCSAWRNVSEILDYQINGDDFYISKYHRLGIKKWEPYLQNMKTIVEWLSSPVGITEKKKPNNAMIEMPPTNLFSLLYHSSLVDVAWCAVALFAPEAQLLNHGCLKLGRS